MKRTWDESNSPQWRYLLGKESERKKEESKRKLFTGEGEIKRNKPGVQKRNRIRSSPLGVTKTGKEIVYSASPGPPLLLQQQQLTTELHDILRRKKTTTTTEESPTAE